MRLIVPYLERDFVAVTNVAGSSNLLVVHPTMGVTTTRALIALLKSGPGEANNWNGVVAPAATPRAVVDRLHREIAAVPKETAIVERTAASALEPIGDTPEEFARYLRSEADKWGKLVKTAGIKPE